MKNKSGRRVFLKNISVSGTAAALFPSAFLTAPGKKEGVTEELKNSSKDNLKENIKGDHKYNSTYTGEYLNRIAFPIGGLGAGMFCMEGTGAISHMSVR
ncbi:MAG: hypothetical protein ABJA71_12100, partial [Ginsengibacter sp.]